MKVLLATFSDGEYKKIERRVKILLRGTNAKIVSTTTDLTRETDVIIQLMGKEKAKRLTPLTTIK